jgi:hypothetical protein
MSETVAIVGSRPPKGNDSAWIDAVTDKVWDVMDALPAGTMIVTGGAKGVDMIAEDIAAQGDFKAYVFYPDWDTHGKSAGAIRNKRIVVAADRVIAFWDGKSKGTKITIDMARRAGKPVQIVEIP